MSYLKWVTSKLLDSRDFARKKEACHFFCSDCSLTQVINYDDVIFHTRLTQLNEEDCLRSESLNKQKIYRNKIFLYWHQNTLFWKLNYILLTIFLPLQKIKPEKQIVLVDGLYEIYLRNGYCSWHANMKMVHISVCSSYIIFHINKIQAIVVITLTVK